MERNEVNRMTEEELEQVELKMLSCLSIDNISALFHIYDKAEECRKDVDEHKNKEKSNNDDSDDNSTIEESVLEYFEHALKWHDRNSDLVMGLIDLKPMMYIYGIDKVKEALNSKYSNNVLDYDLDENDDALDDNDKYSQYKPLYVWRREFEQEYLKTNSVTELPANIKSDITSREFTRYFCRNITSYVYNPLGLYEAFCNGEETTREKGDAYWYQDALFHSKERGLELRRHMLEKVTDEEFVRYLVTVEDGYFDGLEVSRANIRIDALYKLFDAPLMYLLGEERYKRLVKQYPFMYSDYFDSTCLDIEDEFLDQFTPVTYVRNKICERMLSDTYEEYKSNPEKYHYEDLINDYYLINEEADNFIGIKAIDYGMGQWFKEHFVEYIDDPYRMYEEIMNEDEDDV